MRARGRRLGALLLREGVLDLVEVGALDLEGEDAGEGAGGLQPVGLHFELGGVADGLAGGGIGDGLQSERRVLAAGHGDELKGFGGEADEFLGVAVEDPGGELAGGAVAEELEIVGMLAELDEGAAVRRDMGVRVTVIVAGVVGFLGAASDEDGKG